jgi:TolA-binding protein
VAEQVAGRFVRSAFFTNNYSEYFFNKGGNMMTEEQKNLEQIIDDLNHTVQKLSEQVEQLQKEVAVLRENQDKPVLNPAIIGQIGGFVLGAIVLIGIFW